MARPPSSTGPRSAGIHFRARGVTGLLQIGAAALDTARYGDAVSAARHALALEPFSEPAMMLLMRAQALSGDGAGALVALRDFAARIAAEIGENEPPAGHDGGTHSQRNLAIARPGGEAQNAPRRSRGAAPNRVQHARRRNPHRTPAAAHQW